VVGAVAEDGTTDDVERFVLRMLAPELAALEATTDVTDVKSRLQAAVQTRLGLTPEYTTIGVEGPDHARIYRVQVRIGDSVAGEGSGKNKRTAERAAATEALARWEDDRR
jgi:ribonuclease-3